jgi:hypothetical protein
MFKPFYEVLTKSTFKCFKYIITFNLRCYGWKAYGTAFVAFEKISRGNIVEVTVFYDFVLWKEEMYRFAITT